MKSEILLSHNPLWCNIHTIQWMESTIIQYHIELKSYGTKAIQHPTQEPSPSRSRDRKEPYGEHQMNRTAWNDIRSELWQSHVN